MGGGHHVVASCVNFLNWLLVRPEFAQKYFRGPEGTTKYLKFFPEKEPIASEVYPRWDRRTCACYYSVFGFGRNISTSLDIITL